MQVDQGQSSSTSARTAVEEATASFSARAREADLVLVFASTQQDPDALVAAIGERFPRAKIAGCTTAGELFTGGHATGSVVVTALTSPDVKWSVATATSLSRFDETAAKSVSDRLFEGLGLARDAVDLRRHVCLTFLDGLSRKEEVVVSHMADVLEGITLLGGSSGDDLGFRETRVFSNEGALKDAGIFVLAETAAPFTIIKHQHYTTTPRSVVVTRADLAQRRVYEIDGYPAIEAYARALGLSPAEVTNDVTFMNPLTLLYGGELYVRSIQRVEPDGSIIFYCGIEEGMVLSIGGHEPMTDALTRDLGDLARTKPDLFIACNCILRALEADKRALHADLAGVLAKTARHVVGFDTYGEQLNGLHINQTLVGLALRSGEASS